MSACSIVEITIAWQIVDAAVHVVRNVVFVEPADFFDNAVDERLPFGSRFAGFIEDEKLVMPVDSCDGDSHVEQDFHAFGMVGDGKSATGTGPRQPAAETFDDLLIFRTDGRGVRLCMQSCCAQ